MSSRSLLELLHPAGAVSRVLVLGGAPTTGLVPAAARRASDAVDLVVIAPSADDLRQRDWLSGTGRAARNALAEDGIVYALLPRRHRSRGSEELRRSGLLLEATMIQLGTPAPRYLVPLTPGAWRYAFGSLIAAQPLLRRLLVTARRLPLSARWLAALAPAVGVVGRRPDAPPLAAWVSRLEGDPPDTAGAVAAASWRPEGGSTILHCFPSAGAAPAGVVKVTSGASAEPEVLARLGPAALRAGARIPRLLAKGTLGDGAVIAESVVAGTPAAAILARRPAGFDRVVTSLAEWLERWSVDTATRDGGVRHLEARLMSAVDGLAHALPDPSGYRSRLVAACASLDDRVVPLVAAHNDLTMWNLLIDSSGVIGVIDWGEAEEAGLPLTDFFYGVADAMATSTAYRTRLEAVRRCFPESAGGRPRALQARLMNAIGVPAEAAELCFHACWLRHAYNESMTGTGDTSFLEIARWLARPRLGPHA